MLDFDTIELEMNLFSLIGLIGVNSLFGFLFTSNRQIAENMIAQEKDKNVEASKLASLGTMAGGLAHELNNPLAIIAGTCEMIEKDLEKGQLDPKAIKHSIKRIHQTTDRISEIGRALMIYAQKSNQTAFESTDLNEIVSSVVVLFQARALTNEVLLEFKKSAPALIRCNQGRVAQVFVNLISNSMEAVKGQADAKIKLRVWTHGADAFFTIEDNGKGIPLELRSKIMDPFITTKDVGKGVGLGLSISFAIIKEHAGDLTLEPTGRTKFKIRIPLLIESAE